MRCLMRGGIGGASERNGDGMAELTDIAYIKALLTRHGFHFSKKLGQNFLINPAVCPRMAEACGVDRQSAALEIGPGVGVLTKELAKRVQRSSPSSLTTACRPCWRKPWRTLTTSRSFRGTS